MLTTRRPLARLAPLGLLGLCCAALGVLAACVLTGRFGEMPFAAAASVTAILLGTALASAYAGLFLKAAGKIRVAFEIAGLCAALLGAEVLLRVIAPQPATTQQARKIDADRLGLPFDLRTKSEVVDALRATGVEAFPGMSREWPRHPSVRQQLPEGLFPLSDAANSEIVECNESGQYLRFHSDEFGFNNPPGLLLSGNVQVAAVGESFTLGHCVPGGDSFISRLRQVYPRLANLGMEGSGALAMLATFREYVEPLKPPVVLWIIHSWSADAQAEYADPILRRYLDDPGFSQHLMRRRAEVDEAMRAIALPVQYESDAAQERAMETAKQDRFAGILTLSQLRQRLHLPELLAKPSPAVDLTPFDRSVDLARRTTGRWGGRFVVVIMPLYEEVVTPSIPGPIRHEQLAGRLRRHGVEVIDTVPRFMEAPDPAGLYLMRRANHPSAAGHRLLADFITAQLTEGQLGHAMLAHQGTHE
jgi:hypothetical protein